MTTLTGGRYSYAPDEYENEEPLHELHPATKRQALRIARRDFLWKLRQTWLSAVGVIGLLAAASALLLTYLEMFLPGLGVLLVSCLATLYLLSLAMRPGRE